MQGKDHLKRHAQLMDSMAGILGVDLQEAAIRGAISVDAISDAVLLCADCPDPGHCETWLAAHAGGAEETPGYCRNKAVLEQLRPGSR